MDTNRHALTSMKQQQSPNKTSRELTGIINNNIDESS